MIHMSVKVGKAGAETKWSQECSKKLCVLVYIPAKLGESFYKCSASQFEIEKLSCYSRVHYVLRDKNKAIIQENYHASLYSQYEFLLALLWRAP